MGRKNILIIIGLIVFIAIAGGISYSFFVYNKDVADVSLDTGDIAINLANINGSLNLGSVLPKTNSEGIASDDYLDFTVNATVDAERIYYEVYILPRSGNTLDTNYLKTYLTDQNNNVLNDVMVYSILPASQLPSGRAIYRGLINLNNDYSPRSETKYFRLRLWLDENYPELTSKTFSFDIFLYAKNVPENFVVPAHPICSGDNCVLAVNVSFDNTITGFTNCHDAQCALMGIDQMLNIS